MSINKGQTTIKPLAPINKTAKITEQKTTADRKKYPAMVKAKKKLTAAQKRAKKKAKEERQKKLWVFMNGKQVRVKRPETIDGLDSDEFIRNNADPIWLHQNGM